MKDQADYSKYKCPFSHIEKECGHKLHGPEGYENVAEIWCPCGFQGPVLVLDPKELGLELLNDDQAEPKKEPESDGLTVISMSNEMLRRAIQCYFTRDVFKIAMKVVSVGYDITTNRIHAKVKPFKELK